MKQKLLITISFAVIILSSLNFLNSEKNAIDFNVRNLITAAIAQNETIDPIAKQESYNCDPWVGGTGTRCVTGTGGCCPNPC